MLEGERNKVCDICYKEKMVQVTPLELILIKTHYGFNQKLKMIFQFHQIFNIDIRFSNLCNFKCRMCNHDFSSNWYEDYKKLRPSSDIHTKTKVMRTSETIGRFNSTFKNIKSFLLGGEPLIMPEHYKILKHLYNTMKPYQMLIDGKQKEARNLSIHYNTNLSVIKYDEESLIDLWRGFSRVYLSISCDGIGKVGEYQRTV